MKKRLGYLLCGLLLAAVLSGCEASIFKTAEELYAQPQLPAGYENLNETIQSVMSSLDVEQAAPLSGSNTSAVQLLDLDGDGKEDAAAAFFRSNSAEDPQPLKIYLFRMGGDGAYKIAYTLQGEGNSINSIAYQDLDGDGYKEVVVSWQLTTRANVLSVYRLGPMGATELMHTTYNESYALADLDGDGYRELVVIQRDDTGTDYSRASYYTCQDGTLVLTSTANLSENVLDVLSLRTGVVVGQTPAIYVNSSCEGGQITDILICEDGELKNITLDPESGVSKDTLRDYVDENVKVTDINNDGVLEVPVALTLPSVSPENISTYRIIYWRHFNSSGEATVACITYHAVNDGWYLVLPSDWAGQIAVERDTRETYRGEWAMVFYHRTDTGAMERFMTIYRLTGSNRAARAKLGSRQPLLSTSTTAYAVEFIKDGWDCGLTLEQLKERFALITPEWSTDDGM